MVDIEDIRPGPGDPKDLRGEKRAPASRVLRTVKTSSVKHRLRK